MTKETFLWVELYFKYNCKNGQLGVLGMFIKKQIHLLPNNSSFFNIPYLTTKITTFLIAIAVEEHVREDVSDVADREPGLGSCLHAEVNQSINK